MVTTTDLLVQARTIASAWKGERSKGISAPYIQGLLAQIPREKLKSYAVAIGLLRAAMRGEVTETQLLQVMEKVESKVSEEMLMQIKEAMSFLKIEIEKKKINKGFIQ